MILRRIHCKVCNRLMVGLWSYINLSNSSSRMCWVWPIIFSHETIGCPLIFFLPIPKCKKSLFKTSTMTPWLKKCVEGSLCSFLKNLYPKNIVTATTAKQHLNNLTAFKKKFTHHHSGYVTKVLSTFYAINPGYRIMGYYKFSSWYQRRPQR